MASNGLHTYIESLGVYLPKHEVSSKARVAGIPTRIKIPLQRFTGIEATRRAGPGEYSLDLACRAIERCLARSAYHAEQIGLVIAANISKYDREGFTFPIEPNTATSIRERFGFKNALAFDVNNACAGVFTAILIADCFLHTTNIQVAMVVSGEYISHLSDTAQREIRSLTDSRMACLTLGDAGAAVVLARSEDPSVGFRHIGLTTFGEYSHLCVGVPSSEDHGGAIMYTDSNELLSVGSAEAAKHVIRSLKENDWNWDMVNHAIPHQVSVKATDATVALVNSRRGGVKLPRKKVIDNLAKRGNTSTTSHLVALEDHIENGRIKSGERIVFSIIASGLTVGTALYVLDDLPARVRRNGTSHRGPNLSPKAVQADSRGLSIVSAASTRRRRGAPLSTDDLSVEAAEACLARATMGKQDIDVLLFAGVFKSGFLAEPSYASVLAGKLLPKGRSSDSDRVPLAFDVHCGPAGFLASCEVLKTMLERRQIRAGLVITAECDNNRPLDGYPDVGLAEVASAALILPPGRGDVEVRNCDFFSFEEYADCYQADAKGIRPPHVVVKVRDDYELRLRECIGRALEIYLPRVGRTLVDFDEFHFPQISAKFLDALAKQLEIPRARLVDVTVEGRDLYTSSVPCTLEESLCVGLRGSGRCGLMASAGPGIQVACAVLQS